MALGDGDQLALEHALDPSLELGGDLCSYQFVYFVFAHGVVCWDLNVYTLVFDLVKKSLFALIVLLIFNVMFHKRI